MPSMDSPAASISVARDPPTVAVRDRRWIEEIVSLARWAPSGDNAQNWRFEFDDRDDYAVVVHGFDTRADCVYDLDGRASQLALGALLETFAIAASGFGRACVTTLRPGRETHPVFELRFPADVSVTASPLIAAIESRSVQRRPLKARPLTSTEKLALEGAAGPDHVVRWYEPFWQRARMTRLLFRNARLRLTMPEAYEVHRRIIRWDEQFSEEGVPDAALGASRLSLVAMRQAMRSWQRVTFANRWLAGTWMPRLEMDVLPALACAAHFTIVARQAPRGVDDHVAAGRAVQRLWLTATTLGLQSQPAMTPVIFSRYVRDGTIFTASPDCRAQAIDIEHESSALFGAEADRVVWLARIGAGPKATARSTRLPLSRLRHTS